MVDLINRNHLAKYKKLIDQIGCECAKQEQLKKHVLEENNKIIVLNLMHQNDITDIRQKGCFIKVKIFNSIFDIRNLYDDKIDNDTIKNLSRYKKCKYYLLEVYVQKSFYSNIVHQNWIMNICIKSAQQQVCRSVPITEKLTYYPIYEIIPFGDATHNSVVEAHLLLPSGDNYMYLQLNKVYVDISYNFESSNNNIGHPSFYSRVFSLEKHYAKHYNVMKLIKSPQVIRYGFTCGWTKQCFVKVCTKNSYHLLEIETFSDVINKDYFSLQVINSEGFKSTLFFNKKKDFLSFQAGVKDIHQMKHFFINELCNGTIILDKKILSQLINLQFYVHAEMPKDKKEKNIYKEIKNLFHQLPV